MKSQRGFTLIELLVVVFIIATLTTIVTANFMQLRRHQQLQNAARDLTSKIRGVQNFVLTGKIQGSEAGDAYELIFTPNSLSYVIELEINGVTTSPFETVAVPQNVQITDVRVGGSLVTEARVYLTAPFGKMNIYGGTGQTAEIVLQHTLTGRTLTILVDAISGRIQAQ